MGFGRFRIFAISGGSVACFFPVTLLAVQEPRQTEAASNSIAVESDQESGPKPPIDGIRDNSFFIEEAYNQEPGVVQHIFTGLFSNFGDERALDLSFTQEWPVFTRKHQISYTLPYAFLDTEHTEHDSGLGDVLLNYRYQWTDDVGSWPAFTPRFSLVFPSGDEDRGMGVGVPGYQLNLPFSKTLNDRMYANFNMGLTYYPDAEFEFSNGRRPHDRDLLNFNLGASIIYALSDDLHLMLEAAGNFEQSFEEYSTTENGRLRVKRPRSTEVVISPGIRWATNLPEMQLVYGLAFPIGLTDDAPDFGVFLYMSIEHPFIRGAMD